MVRLSPSIALALLCVSSTAWAQSTATRFQKVVITGDVLYALGPDYEFKTLHQAPVIDRDGLVAFDARFDGPDVFGDNGGGIFHGTATALSLVLRSQSQAPGLPDGVLYDSPQFLTVQSADHMVFNALLTGDVVGSNDLSVYEGGVLSLRPIARTSWDVPDTTGTYRLLKHRPVLNSAGQFAFTGDLDSTNSHRAMMFGAGNQIGLVAETGRQAPGFDDGVTFGRDLWGPVLADTGRLAFLGGVSNGVGVFAGHAGAIGAIARRRDPAPGIDGATLEDLFSPSISPSGRAAFPTTVDRNGVSGPAVFRETAELAGIELVAGPDTLLPGMSESDRPRQYSGVTINESGTVAFVGRYYTGNGLTTENDEGMWLLTGDAYELAVREGEPNPALPDGVEVLFTASNRYSGLNARGQLAFLTNLQGEVDDTSDRALLGWDPVDGLELLLRTGDDFEVASGDLRTIELIDFVDSFYNGTSNRGPGGTGGSARGLNDDGMAVVGLRFTDGTAGVFTTVIPSPGSLVAMGLGLGGLLPVHRRR